MANLSRLLLCHESIAKESRGATHEVAFVDAIVTVVSSKRL